MKEIRTTDQTLDLLVEATPVITELIDLAKNDEQMKSLMLELKPGISNQAFALKAMPVILKKEYRQYVYKIIGIFNEKTAEEVATQTFTATMADLRKLLNDEFINFFKSIT